MSSGWFDRTKTFLSTSLKGKQGVQGTYALVRGGSSTLNLIGTVKPPRTHVTNLSTLCYLCDVVVRVGSMRFDVLELPRTTLAISVMMWFVEVYHMSSGWFDCTEPSLSTSLQGKQGAYALVQGCSSTSNHFNTEIARCSEWFDCTEHSLTTSLQGKRSVFAISVMKWFDVLEPP